MKYEAMWIAGDPKTKGSWIPVQTKAGVKFRPATKGASKWYKDARAAVAAQWRHPVVKDAPVRCRFTFLLPRPKTVIRVWPTGRRDGDIDKLVRALLDAMTGVVYGDDSQVVDSSEVKHYTDGEAGAWIRVDTDL